MSWYGWRGRCPSRSSASTRAARRSRSPRSRAGPRSNMSPPRRFSKPVLRVHNDASERAGTADPTKETGTFPLAWSYLDDDVTLEIVERGVEVGGHVPHSPFHRAELAFGR